MPEHDAAVPVVEPVASDPHSLPGQPAAFADHGEAKPDVENGEVHAAGHHHFDFAAALAHHNMPYPAWEPVHGTPLIVFDQAGYAARNFADLTEDPAFVDAAPSALQVAWAREYLDGHPRYESLGDQPLARAMVVADEHAVLGSFPRYLSWFNQQTFFGTIALLLMSFLVLVAARRRPGSVKPANTLQHLVEAVVVFVRDDIVRPNIRHGDHWVPHFTALFLAILSFNLVGLIPGTGTASGNAGVTSGFAITTLACMLFFGIREQGFGRFWVNLSPVHFSFNPVDLILWPLLWVIELMGLFIRPVALSIRLFANMFAGHAVLLSFSALGMIVFAAQPKMMGLAAALGALGWVVTIALMMLELLVAFVQAYVFTLLSAIFIGSAMHPDH